VPVGVGAMAAILGLQPAEVREICRAAAEGQVVQPANFNGPGQVVIAGHAAAVRRAMAGALARGARRALELPVSAPFHCALMAPAAEKLRAVMGAITISDPAVPVWTNVDAEAIDSSDAVRSTLLRQVDAPVRWEEEIQGMVRSGISRFLEVGPGRVLTGLVKRIAKDARVMSVSDPESVVSAVKELGVA